MATNGSATVGSSPQAIPGAVDGAWRWCLPLDQTMVCLMSVLLTAWANWNYSQYSHGFSVARTFITVELRHCADKKSLFVLIVHVRSMRTANASAHCQWCLRPCRRR